ncbi:MAG: hypothetical protein ACR2MD_06105, partial [Aridibacter sp.]
ETGEPSPILKSVNFLQNAFKREQVLSKVKADKFPLGFIPKQTLRYFYQADEKTKKSKKKQINANRYELFVYQSLINAINAGDINCSESLKFRSFEDDLIDDKTWKEKGLLIKQANLPILSEPIETHLEKLENKLEESLREVNRRISDKENKSFEQKQKSSRWSLKYPAKLENDSDSFFVLWAE